MKEKLLTAAVKQAYNEKRRLVVPLAGFPGINITGSTIKLAQQNYDEHFKVVKANVERFQPDAVFPLMDLSVEANALGRYTLFPKEESATVARELFTMEELEKITNIRISCDTRLRGYTETIKLMSHGLSPGILRGAYVSGPYTLAGLLMGADDAAASTVMNPDDLHKILKVTTSKVLEYVKLLAACGAQMICVLDPSAVMLGPVQFEEFAGNYTKKIVQICKDTDIAVVYHICGNTMHLIEKMCETGVDALSLDSPVSGVELQVAAEKATDNMVIIGNINPVGRLLNGSPDEVILETNELLLEMEKFPNFILSTGCDLPQETPLENIDAFMKAGRDYKL